MATETPDTRPSATLRGKWHALSPMQQKLILAGAAVDTAAKAVAIADLSRRPAGSVRGPKWLWAVALPVVNSAGLLPLAYFRFGRRCRC